MNHFIAGILRIILLEAGVALLIIGRLIKADDRRRSRRLDIAFISLAALSLFSWTNFGSLRGGSGIDQIVHRWEQYHFFFGSKYLPEVGYFDLYKATILADREIGGPLGAARRTRDLTSFDEVPVEQAMSDAGRVRAAFSLARWESFKSDWQRLSRRDSIWIQAIDDHGNSGSPAWAIFAAPIAYIAGIGPAGQVAMAAVDIVLMISLFIFIFETFGLRATCYSIFIWALIPFVFDYLAGSLLRWDWFFALGMCLCFWQRKRPLIAGLFLGYAIASKLFPLFFGVALLFKVTWDVTRSGKLKLPLPILRFGAGAAIAIVLSVLISSAMFGGPGIWRQYAGRIEVAQREKFYSNQYSFKTVFLQFAASTPSELAQGLFIPNEIKQGRNDVDISRYQGTYLFFQLLLTALVAFSLSKADELEALAAGPLLVFVWLTVNAYYWNMLALPALIWMAREARGKRGALATMIFLQAALACFYLYQHFNRGYAEGYAGGLAMLGLLLLWAVMQWRRRKETATEPVTVSPAVIRESGTRARRQ